MSSNVKLPNLNVVSPTLVTPVLGAATGTSLALTGAMSALAGVSSPWTTGQQYIAGAYATASGYLIQCQITHTASTYSTDVQSGYWQMASPMKNFLINGGFDISQRYGTTATAGSGSGVYVLDRWWTYVNAGATTAQQVASNDQYGKFACRLNGDGVSIYVAQGQSLEFFDSFRLAGKAVTFSCYLLKSVSYTNQPSITLRYGTPSGTEERFVTTGYINASSTISNSNISSSAYTRFSVTTTIPSNATQVAVYIEAASGSAIASGQSLSIRNCMLNEGPAPALFQTAGANIQAELAMCQRYYQTALHNRAVAGAYSATNVSWRIPLIVTMRTAATIQLKTGATLTNSVDKIGIGGITPTSFSFGTPSAAYAHIDSTHPALTFIAYQPTMIILDIFEAIAEL